MASAILFRLRWLITFIVLSLVAFGYTYYFLAEDTDTPEEGILFMYYVLIGRYEVSAFPSNNVYLFLLLLLVSLFNVFFIFTLLVALSVSTAIADEIEDYQERAWLISFYSYLLTEKAVRDPAKRYLMVVTVTERSKDKKEEKAWKGVEKKVEKLALRVEKVVKEAGDKGGEGNKGE